MIEVVISLLCGFLFFVVYFLNLEPTEQQALSRSIERNICYYIPPEFTDGAVGFASDRIHTPDLLKLLILSPERVAELLGLGDKKHARKAIDAIVRVLQEKFRPGEVYVGGSFKQHTALRCRFDVDLVMKVTRFEPSQLCEIAVRIKKVLRQAFGAAIEFTTEPCHPFYVVTFVVADGLQFDIVTTGFANNAGASGKYYSAATSHIADTAIAEFGASHKLFRPLALLCKHWAYSFTQEGAKRPRSYFIELYVMETIRKAQPGNHASLDLLFSSFLQLIDGSQGRVCVKNLNPNGYPQWISISGHPWTQFQAYASDTLDKVRLDLGAFRAIIGSSCVHPEGHESWESLQLMTDSDSGKSDCLVRNEASECTYNLPVCPSEYLRHYDGEVNFWEGVHRYVSKGTYNEGKRRGEPCVVKWFKTGDVFEARFYGKDLMTIMQAAVIVDSFNCLLRVRSPSRPYHIRVNGPGVWATKDWQKRLKLVEPFLNRFRKFNSNTAMVDAEHEVHVMQALSHFSYHITDGKCLLCNLQGQPPGELEWKPTYILTDPVICSEAREYGPLDLGMKGIENFFYFHKCNSFCGKEWSKARGYPHFHPSWGSLMSD